MVRKSEMSNQERQVANILKRAGGAAALTAENLDLKDRQTLWDFWKTDRHQGFYKCILCGNMRKCAGERADLMICRVCFLPERPLIIEKKEVAPVKRGRVK